MQRFSLAKISFLIDSGNLSVYNTTMTDIPNNHTLIDFHRPAEFPLLRLTDKFVFVGSCFSDEMSKRLKRDCIDTIVNPFGTIYNPVSIYDCLRWCLSDRMFNPDDMLSYQGIYFTQYHSTIFDSNNSNELLENASKSLETKCISLPMLQMRLQSR